MAAGAKAPQLKGSVTADGSSTVGPWTTAAAEGYRKVQPGVRVTVGISGTGGGFEKFCRGEIDLANASRAIKSTEYATCREQRDQVGRVHGRERRDHARHEPPEHLGDCLTTAELKKIWNTGSKVDNWKDVRAGFPDVPLKLFGPGTDSGTFDFFTEFINGKAKASRSDYTASEDDNILVQGVSGTRGGLGYFGLSYYLENQSKLRLIKVDGGRGLRRSKRQDGAEPDVQAALACALHLRKAGVVRAVPGSRVHRLRVEQPGGDREARRLRRAHAARRRSARASTTARFCARSVSAVLRGERTLPRRRSSTIRRRWQPFGRRFRRR